MLQAGPVTRARLLASSAPSSGAWLHALPCANLGLRLGNDELRIAVGLRLGCPLVRPHKCICGTEVDELGHHGCPVVGAPDAIASMPWRTKLSSEPFAQPGFTRNWSLRAFCAGMGSDLMVPLWTLGALGGILFGTLRAQTLSRHPTSSLRHLRLRRPREEKWPNTQG